MCDYRKKMFEFVMLVIMGMILCSVLILLCDTKNVKADSEIVSNDKQIEDAFYPSDYSGYRFAAIPGTSEWPYGDYTDMIKICEIPENDLHMMTTDELLQTVLVHPIMLDIYAYDDFQVGYEIVKGYCGCLQELCSRQDRVDALYGYLRDHREYFANATESTGDEYLDHLIRRPKLVFSLLAENQDFYTSEITNADEARDAINSILCDRYSGSDESQPGREPSQVEFHAVISTSSSGSASIYTPNGGSMTGYVMSSVVEEWLYSDGMYRTVTYSDLSSGAKTALASEMYGKFGLYPATAYPASIKYNCHSYAWSDSQFRYWYWVNTFNTYGYTTTTMQNINNGGIVVYYDSYGDNIWPWTTYRHSAVVIGKYYTPNYGLNLKSKWGIYGLYSHTIGNCPYYYYDPNNSNYNPCDRKYYNP